MCDRVFLSFPRRRESSIIELLMILYKCDSCKKPIDEKDGAVSAGFGTMLQTKIFCGKCAKPVADFLYKHGFGKDKIKKL